MTGTALNLEPRYNIAPTQQIDVIHVPDDKTLLAKMRWGLIPPWWKKSAKETPSTFNARAETVAEKPFFRSAFKRQRCIIPASGFYEWVSAGKNQPKQPFYISATDGSASSMRCALSASSRSGWSKGLRFLAEAVEKVGQSEKFETLIQTPTPD